MATKASAMRRPKAVAAKKATKAAATGGKSHINIKSNAKRGKTMTVTSTVETVPITSVASEPTRRRVHFQSTTKAPAEEQNSGIVKAKSALKSAGDNAAEKKKRKEEEEEEEEEEVASLVSDSDDDEEESAGHDDNEDDSLSDLADDEDEDSDEEDDAVNGASNNNPFTYSKTHGTPLAYPVLCLRFLPPQFEEPQLYKFLGQFGANVLNCFCVRSRRTHQSKGIAYVQFDKPEIIPTLVEECHGMALGGRAVQARQVTLHRAMPTRENVNRRRHLAYAYKTKGAPLKRHNVLQKNPVALLIKAARSERANNAHLKYLGIDFASHIFADQLAHIPAELVTKKIRGLPAKSTADATEVVEQQTAAATAEIAEEEAEEVAMPQEQKTTAQDTAAVITTTAPKAKAAKKSAPKKAKTPTRAAASRKKPAKKAPAAKAKTTPRRTQKAK